VHFVGLFFLHTTMFSVDTRCQI